MRSKPIRIAFLDDEPINLQLIQASFDKCKEKLGKDIEVDVFTSYQAMLKQFNHDVAVIDLDLELDRITGKEVGKMIIQKYPEAQVLAFSNYTPTIENKSFVLKNFTGKNLFSEIIDKYIYFTTHRAFNKLSFLRLETELRPSLVR
jgi:CheY-like chemotaxis protein